jgi:carbonic anhydrase
LASIEYAAVHLHTPPLVLMGHQKCGAVTTAAESGEAEGHLPSLLALIRPAVERARAQPGDLIDNAVRINVENVVRQVRGSTPVLAALVDRGACGVSARTIAKRQPCCGAPDVTHLRLDRLTSIESSSGAVVGM